MFFDNTANTFNFYVRKNIFHRAENSYMNISAEQWNGLDGLVLEENILYQPPDKVLVWWRNSSYTPQDFETYQRDTGKDSNSKLITPRDIRLEPRKLELVVGSAKQLKVRAFYTRNISFDVTNFARYASTEPLAVSVNSKGVAKGLRAGKAMVVVMFEHLVAVAPVSVHR
jgi:hypothetical protein